MNENINLCEILKDCPKGIKFCSYIHGEVEFVKVEPNSRYPIWVMTFPKVGDSRAFVAFTKEGYADEYYNNEKCILVPSFEQTDWRKWKCPKPKFDPMTLKPFDKVLVRDANNTWEIDLFGYIDNDGWAICLAHGYSQFVPLNDDTKELYNTRDEAPEYYRCWED